jgi:hypothetical protein
MGVPFRPGAVLPNDAASYATLRHSQNHRIVEKFSRWGRSAKGARDTGGKPLNRRSSATARKQRTMSGREEQRHFRLRDGVRLVGRNVVFDGVWGNFYRASSMAERALLLLRDGTSASALADAMKTSIGDDTARARGDVAKFLEDLSILGLIEEIR